MLLCGVGAEYVLWKLKFGHSFHRSYSHHAFILLLSFAQSNQRSRSLSAMASKLTNKTPPKKICDPKVHKGRSPWCQGSQYGKIKKKKKRSEAQKKGPAVKQLVLIHVLPKNVTYMSQNTGASNSTQFFTQATGWEIGRYMNFILSNCTSSLEKQSPCSLPATMSIEVGGEVSCRLFFYAAACNAGRAMKGFRFTVHLCYEG
ncbi:hypothetical protein TSUD_298210 [Trifolium subterraneum]|nr:hypothetical protein TSUD_298210 [Trifolium subterraneum]